VHNDRVGDTVAVAWGLPLASKKVDTALPLAKWIFLRPSAVTLSSFFGAYYTTRGQGGLQVVEVRELLSDEVGELEATGRDGVKVVAQPVSP